MKSITRSRAKIIIVAILFSVINAGIAWGADSGEGGSLSEQKSRDRDALCWGCHAQTFRRVYIDPQKYKLSKHSSLGVHCYDCHGRFGFTGCIHISALNLPKHLEETKERCLKCHEKKKTCLECHRDRENWEPINTKAVSLSVHKKLQCKDCHGFQPSMHYDNELRPAANSGRVSCGRCHKKEYKHYLESVHGETLSERPGHAPDCVDCHGSHYIKPFPKRPLSVGAGIAEKPYVCGDCHREEYETYIENYHGRTVTSFNSKKSPTCYDCHGDHDIKSLRDRAEAVKVCRKCHKNAPLKMAGFKIHAEENDPKKEPTLFLIKTGMTMLLVGTLGAFYLHSGIWFYRKRKEKKYGGVLNDNDA